MIIPPWEMSGRSSSKRAPPGARFRCFHGSALRGPAPQRRAVPAPESCVPPHSPANGCENVEYTPLHLHSDVFMDPGHARHPVPRPSGSGHLGDLVLGQSGAVGMAALVECEVRQQRTPPPGLLATRVTVPGRSPDPGTEVTPPQQTT